MSEETVEFDERVRRRAYALWQQAGSPEGREDEFWHRAEQAERESISHEKSGEETELPVATEQSSPPSKRVKRA